MWKRFGAGLCLAATIALAVTTPGRAQDADTVAMHHDPLKYQIVVSATKTPKATERVPNATAVVSGDELRRRGTRTLAEALQDVVGLDTGEGSDNGMTLPNIGMWGLKEFDALLITVDGVPVGGPFNPSLSMIPVEEIDRIEIIKGPQGTLNGVSAFAGLIEVYTRSDEAGKGHITLGGGSFNSKHASLGLDHHLGESTTLRVSGGIQRSDGWQDRTGADVDRGALSLTHTLGGGHLALNAWNTRHTQRWGSPLPFTSFGQDPDYLADRNYAVGGARLDHRVFGGTLNLSLPVTSRVRFENTAGVTHDRQISVRSFVEPDAAVGDDVPSEGVAIRPRETVAYDDARLVSQFEAGGQHELVTGAAITWGRTLADGEGFDFDQTRNDFSTIPDVGSIPPGDLRSFSDRRTFGGLYAHDEWTTSPWLTLSGGGRYDNVSEKLHAQAQEQAPGEPLEVADDSRTDASWSGDLSGLVSLVQHETTMLQAANVYASWKSAFKPAAPNLTEAEGAEILDPEWTHSIEVGLKTRAFDRQVAFDVSWFDMRFENLVVSALGPDTLPALINAGKERFKGFEVNLALSPDVVPGTTLTLGYAHHDPRFVEFSFVTPEGEVEDDSGHLLELAPREMFNARLDLVAPQGVGVFAALRYNGRRALDRDNVFFLEPFTEWDAGASYRLKSLRLSVTGRNLGDDRHVVAESEIGDLQFYLAPPRRVTAEVSYGF